MRATRIGATLGALAFVAAALVLPGQSAAVPPSGTAVTDDRATAVPTSWVWRTGATPAQLSQTVQAGYRIVDLEVEDASPRLTARFVRNTGSYAAPGGWWWYYGQTQAQVSQRLSAHGARLVDVEPYWTSGGLRYAVVMVRNAGVAARSWYWRVGTNATAMFNELIRLGYRPQQVGSFRIGSTLYRTLIAIRNTGSDARSWWWYLNRTPAQVGTHLSTNKARLLNLEKISSTTYDVLMVREPTSFWLWYHGLTAGQVTQVALQTGSRVIDIEKYGTGSSTRYAAVFLDNLDVTSGRARSAMWSRYGSFTQWGFYFKRVGAGTLNGLHHTRQFEPASSIKALVHFHTNLKLQQGQASTAQVLPYKRQNRPDWQNSCPDSSTINGTAALGTMDREMMTASNNPYTHSLRVRFGTANIEATGQAIGMTGTKFNHNIGCGTFQTHPNRTTLSDLGKVYERVQIGHPISGTYRTRFLSNMLNQSNSGAEDPFCAVVKQEAPSLGLSAAFANTYCGALRTYVKGGSYGDGLGNNWFSQSGLLVLPIKGSTRAFVYGDYMQKVKANAGETGGQLFAPLTRATQEMARPQIRSALATY